LGSGGESLLLAPLLFASARSQFRQPARAQAVFDVLDFWFEMGVDGFRLDAIPYLFEREDTNCENLPETHAFLKELRAPCRFEVHRPPASGGSEPVAEDAIAYFGNGDECNMAFHFPLMPRLFMATRMEDRYPIIDILRQTPRSRTTANGRSFFATTTS